MFADIKKRFSDLEQQLMDPALIADQKELVKISQEHASLKKAMTLILELEKTEDNISQNKEIINSEQDGELRAMAQEELLELEKRATEIKEELEEEINPDNPKDKKNAIVEIRAGTGGDEAALFAGDLFRMYSRYCERRKWKLSLIDSSVIGIGGFKEVVFEIKGDGAYGALKLEAGTHRVQRVPTTEKQGRVHTSTATVVVLPEAEEVDLEIKPGDVRIDIFCSSGPGGQSVNTTYSAIRLVHLPTGITVSSQTERSQHQNKERAFQVLRSRLLAKQEDDRRIASSNAHATQVGAGNRVDKIRTYNVSQDRVTDHRINISWHSINRILDGEIEEIIAALRKADKEATAANKA
ncbi:peptide chain release factor 1 [Candidatus Falkowbacteria bacterium]|uniref:Peptide chain release factor 1 n=1 Tax=Candidatus Falkowbacteria bacterium CG10_big_fil_rev_8_21_14_0_10_37_18 TaxID=1974562 RepID=A0A2H0V8J9_9BACT|nr:peptide chain release factor 1 [Candidatus Falkowbacteria bacterium]NCQ12909.1 peptide chain release factor 1 [Candidatus Falkowbacteria bacterium]OIO06354.1 MAG: peptide chain release factor 1 [Candidatus Falkowbacteria bacterium CG1_02_37_21]PIR95402.1 MAG: peptide chain release factor 1 [Candidatus Falkowbacteria bacterium CG10_big_fil_rev_8_21_14_0_10_37_18]